MCKVYNYSTVVLLKNYTCYASILLLSHKILSAKSTHPYYAHMIPFNIVVVQDLLEPQVLYSSPGFQIHGIYPLNCFYGDGETF